MRFAIIGAGDGSRLRDEGIATAKPLVRIRGVPLIERILRIADANGMSAAYLIINESFRAVKDFVESLNLAMTVDCRLLSTPSSMHTLFALAPMLEHEPFCLATVDSVFSADEFHQYLCCAKLEKEAHGVLAVTDYIKDERPLCVTFNSQKRITGFSDSAEDLVWATGGIYFFRPEIFDEMAPALDAGISRLRNFLRFLLTRGYILKAYPFSKIIDVDHASDIAEAEEFLGSLPIGEL
jgi:NDP-sugar pyrophosphorylase family protein